MKNLNAAQTKMLVSLADEPRGVTRQNQVALVLVERGVAKWHPAAVEHQWELRITPEGMARLKFMGLK